jgi:hypothetical protein
VSARFRAWVASHLGSRDVARVLYGTIVGIALVVALESKEHTAGENATYIFVAAVVIGLAELFSEVISLEARNRRRINRVDARPLARDAIAVVIGAGFPAVYFVLAAAGVMTVHTAFVLSRWSGLGLVIVYAFAAARLSGAGRLHSARHAATAAVVGLILVELKALVH